jgi:hypothetical protein
MNKMRTERRIPWKIRDLAVVSSAARMRLAQKFTNGSKPVAFETVKTEREQIPAGTS